MADDDNDNYSDNILQFRQRVKDGAPVLPADDLLEDCMGEYGEVIVIGVDADEEMVITGNIGDVAKVYEMLSSAAQNIALAHLEMMFHGTAH